MSKTLALIPTLSLVLLLPTAARAEETCYQLSANGKQWAKTPELMCVAKGEGKSHTFVLKTGIPPAQTVATIQMELLSSARCMGKCNGDTFGLSNPENSVFNSIGIKFKGKVDGSGGESGTVTIGKTKLHYRRLPSLNAAESSLSKTPPPPAPPVVTPEAKKAPRAPKTP